MKNRKKFAQDSRKSERDAQPAGPSWKAGDLVRFAHGPGPFKVTMSDPRTQMLELEGFSGLFAWSLFRAKDDKLFE